MLPLSFLVYLISLLSALNCVESRPWIATSIELRECSSGPSPPTLVAECTSVCEPVRLAQQTCDGDSTCTCSAAPPSAVDSCLECHIERRDGLQPQWILSLQAARDRYTRLCSNLAPAITDVVIETSPSTPSSPSDNTASPASDSATSLTRREASTQDDVCVYGLPVITWRVTQDSQFSPLVSDRNIFMGILFTIAVVVCIVENRRRHSS